MTTKNSKIDLLFIELKNRIIEKNYSSGEKMPSERKICDEFNVSRDTVRGALRRLQESNLVNIIPKSGVYVGTQAKKVITGDSSAISEVSNSQELKNAGSFILSMEKQGLKATVKFIEPSSIIEVGYDIGEKMNLKPTEKVLRRYRTHNVNNKTYRILDSYYIVNWFEELLGKDEGYIPLFKWLYKNQNVYANKAFEKLNIRMPNPNEARILNISRSQPVVDMDRWVWANEKTLFEYTKIVANASLHEYTYSYNIEKEISE